jgi:TonB family protein
MISKSWLSLATCVALSGFTSAIAADKAAVLIQEAAQKAHAATMWETEVQLIAENAGSGTESTTESPFRISLEYPADVSVPARARLEVIGGETPLVRVCDGHSQWTYLLVAKQYWKLSESELDACAYPFTEWRNLAVTLSAPVIVRNESLHLAWPTSLHAATRTIECAVVRGDFAAQGSATTGSRTLWIDKTSKMIWKYRVERTDGTGKSVVRTYTVLWQTRDGIRRPGDLFEFQPAPGTEVSGPPAVTERAAKDRPVQTPVELPKNLYRIGGFVTAPMLLHKVEPSYTEDARIARIQGTVVLDAEIQPDGASRNVRVTESLDPGLDRKAIEAVSKWRFRPGERDGNPVAVRVTFEVNFRL